MKLIIYYLSLLVLLAVTVGYLLSQSNAQANMSTGIMVGIAVALIFYGAAMSIIGESSTEDQTENSNRKLANRNAMVVGTLLIIIAVLYQLFFKEAVDYWLLVVLMGINIAKIVSLIYLNQKNNKTAP